MLSLEARFLDKPGAQHCLARLVGPESPSNPPASAPHSSGECYMCAGGPNTDSHVAQQVPSSTNHSPATALNLLIEQSLRYKKGNYQKCRFRKNYQSRSYNGSFNTRKLSTDGYICSGRGDVIIPGLLEDDSLHSLKACMCVCCSSCPQ